MQPPTSPPVALIALPGPQWSRRWPGPRIGTRQRCRRPLAAAHSLLALADALRELGHSVVLLPPCPLPDPGVLADLGLANWSFSDLVQAEPSALALAGLGELGGAGEAVYAVAASDCSAGEASLHLSGRPRLPGGQLMATVWQRRLLAAGWRANPAAASAPGWSESAHDHLRLEAEGRSLHLFSHQAAAAMPTRLLPRHQPASSDLEGQRAFARRLNLRPGTARFARQHLASAERGLGLRSICTAGAGRLLLPVEAVAEPAAVAAACESGLPGLRIRVLDNREVTLTEAINGGCGFLVAGAAGPCWLAPAAWLATRRGRRLGDRLQQEGLVAEVRAIDYDVQAAGPLSAAVLWSYASPERPVTPVTAAKLAAWRSWAEQALPEAPEAELTPEPWPGPQTPFPT